MNEPEGLTIIARCSGGLRLVSDQAKPQDWESLPRREPRRARERLAPLKPKAERRGLTR